ncbi:hypothetical protein [Methanolapillus ohkumae]|uniref:PEGA domain-containing protein n=1 Tax=Methanolapillus ohkumae TaxID=3028298 RepID=A0AA96ZWE8_9EURY|nr:hypothetical protein MsAm2_14840 [Methanosarcinaceae archaeon Am2]
MQKIQKLFSALAVFLVLFAMLGVAVAADPIGGSQGIVRVNSDVNGATVQLIDINGNIAYNGTIQNGTVDILIYLTATPVDKIVVSADGYNPITIPMTTYPTTTEPLVVTANFKTVGGSIGTYIIQCNVEGAAISLIDINGKVAYNGTIKNGEVSFPVYLTGTPIDKVKAEAKGYTTTVVTITENCRPLANQTSTIKIEMGKASFPWIPLILIILIILLVIALAYLYYKDKKEKMNGPN